MNSETSGIGKPVVIGKPETYTSTYETSRTIAKIVSAVGWVVVGVGALLLLITIPELAKSRYGVNWLKLIPSIGIALAGFLVVAAGQVTRATVDTADNTGRILSVLMDQSD